MIAEYLKAIESSIEAGKEIINVYTSDDFQVELKDDNSPLTIADKRAHLKILEYLSKTGVPVLSEEGKSISYEERKDWNEMWIVDPLDGTKEFIKRNGEFTVNIAFIKNNKPIFGVIYVPVTKELYFGVNGIGAYKTIVEGEFAFNTLDDLIFHCIKLPIHNNDTFTVVASRSHMSIETEKFIEDLKKEHSNIKFISKGSSLKLCAVAEGVADIYPRFAPTMEWDTAAGQAIVEAMGGKVTKITGEELLYNREDLLNPWFIVRRG